MQGIIGTITPWSMHQFIFKAFHEGYIVLSLGLSLPLI